jgi:hypothetical protein
MRRLFISLLLAGFIEPAPVPAPADSFVPRCLPPDLPARRAGAKPVSDAQMGRFATPRSPVVPLSTAAASLLLTATERSPVVNRLLRELGRSDIVVYVTNLKTRDRVGPRSYMSFLAIDATHRYLLVRIDHWSISQAERIALLGHELQHALEVAEASEVRDAETMARMFRRIGSEVALNTFETRGAREVAHLIRRELR